MQTFRRILLTSALATAASSFASASIIYSGPVTNCVGLSCTVTETASISNEAFQVASPTSLFVFDKFGNLNIAGATYLGAKFEYQYDNVLSSFAITNNDVNPDTVNVSITSTATQDPASSGLSSADLSRIKNSLLMSTVGGVNTVIGVVSSVSNQTINGGSTYTVPGLPVTYTNGASYNLGDPFFTDAISLASVGGTGTFSYGTPDTAAYSASLAGNSGTVNLNVLYTSTYDANAQVVYSYLAPSPSDTPEPATFALFGGALLGLGLLRKRALR